MNTNLSQAQAAQQGNRTSDGKYTFGTHAEPAGLSLTTLEPNLDIQAHGALAGLAVRAAEHAKHFNKSAPPWSKRSDESMDRDIEMAMNIATMASDERSALAQRLRISRHLHLVEPEQRLGNNIVIVPDSHNLTYEEVGQVLATQKDFELLNLSEPAVLIGVSQDKIDVLRQPKYRVERCGVVQEISIGTFGPGLRFDSPSGQSHDERMWIMGASFSGISSYEDEPANNRFSAAADLHLEKLVMASEAGGNERLAPHHDKFKEIELSRRRMVANTRDGEIRLDFSGDRVQVMDSANKPLPRLVADGFMRQFSKSINYTSGAKAMERDLRAVFDNTERQLKNK